MQIIEDQRWLAHVPGVMDILQKYRDIVKDETNKKYPKQTLNLLIESVKADLDFSQLGIHPVYTALFNRYMKMLDDKWEQLANTNISRFRDEIGCNPRNITAECFDTSSLINKYNNALMHLIDIKKSKTMFLNINALLVKQAEAKLETMRRDLSNYKNIRFSEKGFAIDDMAKQGMRKELPPINKG